MKNLDCSCCGAKGEATCKTRGGVWTCQNCSPAAVRIDELGRALAEANQKLAKALAVPPCCCKNAGSAATTGKELVDGALEIVELYNVEGKYNKEWRRNWLARAREFLK